MRHVLHKPTKNQSMCVINGYGAFCPSMSGIIKHNRQFSKHSSLKKVQHAIHVDQCTVMPIYMNQSTKSINVVNKCLNKSKLNFCVRSKNSILVSHCQLWL